MVGKSELDDIPVEVELWRSWRVASNGLLWRVALPEDREAINAVCDDMERRTSQEANRVDPFASPVMLTLVAEDECGLIVDVVTVEALAHISKLSANRQGFASFPDLLPDVRAFLMAKGFTVATMSVPKRWEKLMAPTMIRMGFRSTCDRFAHWFRSVGLRP